MSGVQMPFVGALLVLDTEGQRIAVKYCDHTIVNQTAPPHVIGQPKPDDLKLQTAFEKKVFSKTTRVPREGGFDAIRQRHHMPEVMILEQCVIVYKVVNDVAMYVVGNNTENELILQSVLQALDETVANLLKNQVSRKTLVENLDLLLLSIDEIIDDGLILETDSNLVVSRVCMVGGAGGDKDLPISEQSFTQALQTAKDQLVKSFR